jgi:hypothetical protein
MLQVLEFIQTGYKQTKTVKTSTLPGKKRATREYKGLAIGRILIQNGNPD